MNIISKEVETQNGTIKIHGIQTGKLAIKKSALSSKHPGIWSTLLSFRDKKFGAWLPIWSWVIEHPEGIYLIDTGLSTEVHQPNYFKNLDIVSRYYFEKQMKFQISKEEEINRQLKKIGIAADSISKIVLTHLHIDHTGGLKYFPNTPIVVNEREWQTKDGSFPALFPPDIKIDKIKLVDKFENFGHSSFLTVAKDLVMVATPGHTRGHTSVILKVDENKLIIFGGDVAYSQERLIKTVFSATVQSYKESVESCVRILDLAKKKSVIFLPSHDYENEERLMNDIEIV